MEHWDGCSRANSNSNDSENSSELVSGTSASDLTSTSTSSSCSATQSNHHRYCAVFMKGNDSENSSELISGTSASDLTTTSTSSSCSAIQSNHHRYCAVFIKGDCTCGFVINPKKHRAGRQMEKSLQSTRSSHQSAILAGHLNVSSQQSSEASYHSAQSVVEPCASISNIMNQDINSAYESSSANEAEKAPPDLNQAQDLFSHADGDESMSEGTAKRWHRLLRGISDGTLGSTNESETSQEILKNLSQSFAQNPANFTRRLVTIMEESELNNTLKQLLLDYESQIDVADTSMPTAMDETVITPPDMILHRRGSKAATLRTPKTPKRRTGLDKSTSFITSLGELIKTPQKQSPSTFSVVGTSGSVRNHNDSTFTALEKACGISTPGKVYSPDLREKARLVNIVAEQEKRLATESPVKKCNQATTVALSSKFIEQDSLDDSDEGKDTPANISHSIVEEFEKKLQRIFETHRTMCEIDAESSEASALDETQSSGLVSFLNLLTHIPGYQRYLRSDEIRQALRDRDDSGVDIAPSARRSRCRNLIKSPVDPETLAIKVTLDCHNVTLRKPARARTKSPVASAVQVKSACSRTPLSSSTPRSQRLPPKQRNVCPSPRPTSATPRTPHVKEANYSTPPQSPVSTPRKTLRSVSTTIPNVLVTRLNTPEEKRVGKYFPTPGRTPLGRTPMAKTPKTPRVYFPSQETATPSAPAKTSGLYEWYGLESIKSPVAAYIHGTDSTLVTKVHSKTNECLLTPKLKSSKASSESREQLNFNLAKQRTGSTPIASRRGVNDENTPDNVNPCAIPQVLYELPSDVRQLSEEPSKQRGVRAQRLMQSEAERMVIRHGERTKPQTVDAIDADLSIHMIKSAEKKKSLMRYKK